MRAAVAAPFSTEAFANAIGRVRDLARPPADTTYVATGKLSMSSIGRLTWSSVRTIAGFRSARGRNISRCYATSP